MITVSILFLILIELPSFNYHDERVFGSENGLITMNCYVPGAMEANIEIIVNEILSANLELCRLYFRKNFN